jgi:hypothetical protein
MAKGHGKGGKTMPMKPMKPMPKGMPPKGMGKGMKGGKAR